MPPTTLTLPALLLAAFSLSTWLEPGLRSWAGHHAQSADVLTVLLGDSRRLFARHFYAKADAYFHNGYYPSIFDESSASDRSRVAAGAIAGQEGAEISADVFGPPKDWLDRFSRCFLPSSHIHLGEGEPAGDEPSAQSGSSLPKGGKRGQGAGELQEILPWLRVAADLDPQQPETYVVGSYWMRSRLGKVTEAEQFLREGLRFNPGNPDILFELGRIYRENRQDPARARNLWELALAKWDAQDSAKSKLNPLLHLQLLGNLAKLEEEERRYAKALEYLKLLKEVSPSKTYIEKWIGELQAELPQ